MRSPALLIAAATVLTYRKSFKVVGVTPPVDGSKGLLIKGFNPEGAVIGECAEDFSAPLAHKETYRELPILGEDYFCLGYTWQ